MGGLLILFAAVSFLRGVTPTSTGGLWMPGLSANGPLSILSIVVASFVAGPLLLMSGSYGRISGALPPGNPYRHARPAAGLALFRVMLSARTDRVRTSSGP